MVLVLDTGVLIAIERGNAQMLSRLAELSRTHPIVKTTFANRFEMLVGIAQKSPRNAQRALILLNRFDTLQTNNAVAAQLAMIKTKYERNGLVLPLADLFVASIAIVYGCTLVTTDHAFARITELATIII